MIRQAKQSDLWRAINVGNSASFISEIQCRVDGHEIQTVRLEKGIIAFIGRNGARKTTLIRGVYSLLPSTKKNREIPLEDDNALEVIDAEFVQNKTEVLKISAGGIVIEAFLFDPCSSVPELRSILRADENLEDLWGFGESRELSREEISEIEYLSGNTYNKIEVVIVEDYSIEFPRFPLYRVERNGFSYDSRGMGYGEFSILLFHWIAGQVSNCKDDGENVVLFLEEPESFISPEYQKRLMAFCVDRVASCKCQAFVVSHSEHVIGRIKHSKIHNVRWDSGGIEITALSKNSQVFDELGLVPSRKAFLSCEDVHSSILLSELLRCSQRFGVNEFLINTVKGEGDVRSSLSNTPDILDGFRFIGVLDGDCRAADWSGFRVCFLPSNQAPEMLLIEWFKCLGVTAQAKLLGKTEEETSRIIDNCNGIDHHEYFLKASGNDRTLELVLFRTICFEWVMTNSTTVTQFLVEFEGAYDLRAV